MDPTDARQMEHAKIGAVACLCEQRGAGLVNS